MNERTAVMAGALVGALTGMCAAYLFFTDHGRTLRDRISNEEFKLARLVAAAREAGEIITLDPDIRAAEML